MIAAFVRYTDAAHAHIIPAFPELSNVLVRQTYEEAEGAAALTVLRALADLRVTVPVTIVHKPHQPESADPLDTIGSWGWKAG